MTESADSAAPNDAPANDAPAKGGGNLNSMLLADLKQMAGSMGVKGSGGMKKAELVAAIKQARAGGDQSKPKDTAPKDTAPKETAPKETASKQAQPKQQKASDSGQQPQKKGDAPQGAQDDQPKNQNQGGQQNPQQGGGQQGGQNQQDGDGEGGRNRRRRGRERNNRGNQREPDTSIQADDVLVPAAGILDVLDSYAFVRTAGYLPSANDVYLSLSMVRKLSLRRGDAIVGQVRQPREGERKEKFNPMVRIDSVNGQDPEAAIERPTFEDLVAIHPTERLRLESGPDDTFGRTVDLLAPLAKGHRGLIHKPATTDASRVLADLAGGLTSDDTTAHLMVLLLNGHPEDVAEHERRVRGEVIACPFDRGAPEQIGAAELASERAKRLVELGHDVVMVVDGLSQLGRAYHLQAPASARSVGTGLDPAALQPVKRLFGAGKACAEGGSMTIIATLASGSVSGFDELIAEEIVPGCSWSLGLDAAADAAGLHPPIDPARSRARRETDLLGEREAALVSTVRQALAGDDPVQAGRRVQDRISATRSNIELLTAVDTTQGFN